MSQIMNQRKFPRVLWQVPLRFRLAGRRSVSSSVFEGAPENWNLGCSENISAGGLMMHLLHHEPGQRLNRSDIVKIDLELPDRHNIRAFAEVVWCRNDEQQDEYKAGMQFIAVKDEDMQRLNHLVDSQQN